MNMLILADKHNVHVESHVIGVDDQMEKQLPVLDLMLG